LSVKVVETAAPKVEMTSEQIKKWKRSYKPEMMEHFISGSVKGNSPAAKEVRKASAELAKPSVLKNNAESMENAYGKLYQWIWHGVAMKDGIIHMQSMNAEDCSSWKWIMQLNIRGTWWDWVSVRPSSMSKGVNLGVFAEGDFPVGTTIGYYLGKMRSI
jgi:hypothetical protein